MKKIDTCTYRELEEAYETMHKRLDKHFVSKEKTVPSGLLQLLGLGTGMIITDYWSNFYLSGEGTNEIGFECYKDFIVETQWLDITFPESDFTAYDIRQSEPKIEGYFPVGKYFREYNGKWEKPTIDNKTHFHYIACHMALFNEEACADKENIYYFAEVLYTIWKDFISVDAVELLLKYGDRPLHKDLVTGKDIPRYKEGSSVVYSKEQVKSNFAFQFIIGIAMLIIFGILAAL